MANRCTLHISHLEEFKEWLNGKGMPHRPGKGGHLEHLVRLDKHGWQGVFRRLDMPEHYTVSDKLMPTVRRFLQSRKQA